MEQGTKKEVAPQLFTVKEVMDRLKIGRSTLWRLTQDKGVKTVKVGDSIRYTSEGIDQLIDSN